MSINGDGQLQHREPDSLLSGSAEGFTVNWSMWKLRAFLKLLAMVVKVKGGARLECPPSKSKGGMRLDWLDSNSVEHL